MTKSILKIADRKTSGDIVAYKYNGQKSLAWLALKVKLLAYALKRKCIYSGSSAISANYMKSDPVEEKVYLENACGLVGSYIEEELHDELLFYFSIEKENNGPKRKSVQPLETEQVSKKIKAEGGGLQELKREKEKKHSSKEKAFAKAAVGSKSIASFFK